MSDTPIALLLFICILFFTGRYIYTAHSGRRKVRAFLKRNSAQNITVYLIPSATKKGVYFYEVTYDDEAGRPHMETYKMHSWDSSIYWVGEDLEYK